MSVEQQGNKRVHIRWQTAQPLSVRMGEVTEATSCILSIYCNDTHAFCGHGNGTVGVYNLGSGQLTRNLALPEGMLGNPNIWSPRHGTHCPMQVVGSKEVVAAAIGRSRVVVWSSQGQMEQLHSLNVQNYSCSNDSCEHRAVIHTEIRSVGVVERSKVAILVAQVEIKERCSKSPKVSLILLEKVNCRWENKNLGCFPGVHSCSLATDCTWLALLVGQHKKIKLWRGNESQQDIFLTESDGKLVKSQVGMFIETPHIILSIPMGISALIKVYKMEATLLQLVRSFRFGIDWTGLDCRLRPIGNKFCLGFVETHHDRMATIVHLFEKRKLFAAGLSPDETGRRIEVEGFPVAINSYCLLSFYSKEEEIEQEVARMGLMKKDFWI